jgi:hypothetical protein
LKETGGKTGAAIERIFLGKGRGGGESIGDPCIKGLRLPPGGVLDNFYTDEGVKRLSYCGPYLGTTAEPTLDFPVTVSVVFVDDEGRRGQVDARALVRPGENPAPSSAVLAIEDPFVLGGTTRFLLRETTGNSGATILNVLTGDGRGGADSTGPGCWGKVLRVPPGGMLDTFYTQEGADWLSYCGVWGGMFVTVRFADDTGRIGTVSAQVIVK